MSPYDREEFTEAERMCLPDESPASATVLEAPDPRGGPTPIRYVALVR